MYQVIISNLIPRHEIVESLKLYFISDNMYDAFDSDPSTMPTDAVTYSYHEYDESASNFRLLVYVYTKEEVSLGMELDFARFIAQRHHCNCIVDNHGFYTFLMVSAVGKVVVKVLEHNEQHFKIYQGDDDFPMSNKVDC
jgi:hypothetical protein